MSVVVDGKTYHFSLTCNGVTYGFMRRKGSDTRRRFGDWAPKYSTGDDQFAEGAWQPVSWNDFSGGVGQERYSNSKQSSFYTADGGVETRYAAKATLGGRWVSSDAGKTATSNFVDFGGNIYVGVGTKLRKYDAAGAAWSDVYTAAANIQHLCVDGSNIFLALGSGQDAVKWNGSAATVLTGFKANCFASYDGKLWRALVNNIYSSSDAGATWGSAVPIGDAANDINALLAYGGLLYCGKADSLWASDGTAANTDQKLDFSNQTYAGNFKYMCEWGGYLFFSILRQVARYSSTTWDFITPTLTGDANKELYGWGVPAMFSKTPTALLVAMNAGEGTKANLLAYTGQGWHAIYQATATMAACGYSRAKDWILVNDGATRYQAQVAQADVCTADYAASGEIVLPFFDGGFPWIKKAGREVVLDTQDCTATETVTIAYRTAKDGAYTTLGSTVVSSSAPTTISLDAVNGAIEFYKIQFKLTLARGADTSKRPSVTNFTLRYMNRPNAVFVYYEEARLSGLQRTML